MYLSEILNDMDFRLEKDNGKFKIYDVQTHEYLTQITELFDNKSEIIERMETYLDDYWFREIKEELSELGELDDESWKSMLEKTKKLKHRFSNPEYLTYMNVLECLVNPDLLEA